MIYLDDLLTATGGQLVGPASLTRFSAFCYDSRRLLAGELFVAVKTEKGDGHDYTQDAIDKVQSALNQVSDVRARLGIQERRLYHIIDDLKAEDINISAAKSRIYDADMSVEISEFTRLQILQQSGTAILAQANAQPQSVLQLLQ